MSQMTQNEEVFERPQQFMPDRWSRDAAVSIHHKFASLPFGFGPRACYGINYMVYELQYPGLISTLKEVMGQIL